MDGLFPLMRIKLLCYGFMEMREIFLIELKILNFFMNLILMFLFSIIVAMEEVKGNCHLKRQSILIQEPRIII